MSKIGTATPSVVYYSPTFVAAVDAYIADTLKKKEKPTIDGFAKTIGVDKDTVVAWAVKKTKDKDGHETKGYARPEFLAAVRNLRAIEKGKKQPISIDRGRPTKYGPEIIKKAEAYIVACVDEIKMVTESENAKTGRVRYMPRLVVRLPKVEGLALHLGVHRDTLYEWAKQYRDFSDILERINQIQADRVINEAIAGNYNALIAKLLLGKHGYKERSETEHTGEQEMTVVLKSHK